MIREAYRCDCDGVSHFSDGVLTTTPHVVGNVRRMLQGVGSIVAIEPMTCPWRSLQHPLVKEIGHIAGLAEKGMGMAEIDDATPAIVIDGLALFMQARSSSYAHHTHAYYEDQKRKKR